MKFYRLAFGYRRPDLEEMRKWLETHNPDMEFSPESHALSRAEDLVRQHLSRMGIQHLHEYSWPDGSLSLFIVTDRAVMDLYMEFEKLEDARARARNEPGNVRIRSCDEIAPDTKIILKHNHMNPKGPAIENVRDYFRVYLSEEVPDYILRLLHEAYNEDGFLNVGGI